MAILLLSGKSPVTFLGKLKVLYLWDGRKFSKKIFDILVEFEALFRMGPVPAHSYVRVKSYKDLNIVSPYFQKIFGQV